MSAGRVTSIDLDDDGAVECWCCGCREAPDRVVHLGNHPEVLLCLRCAHFVHQKAWAIEDLGMRWPAAVTRRGFATCARKWCVGDGTKTGWAGASFVDS